MELLAASGIPVPGKSAGVIQFKICGQVIK